MAFLIALLHWAPELAALFWPRRGRTSLSPVSAGFHPFFWPCYGFYQHFGAFARLFWATWQAKVKGVENINSTTDVSGRADR